MSVALQSAHADLLLVVLVSECVFFVNCCFSDLHIIQMLGVATECMCSDQRGWIYICNDDMALSQYDNNWNLIKKFAVPGPWGCTVDEDLNVYVTGDKVHMVCHILPRVVCFGCIRITKTVSTRFPFKGKNLCGPKNLRPCFGRSHTPEVDNVLPKSKARTPPKIPEGEALVLKPRRRFWNA